MNYRLTPGLFLLLTLCHPAYAEFVGVTTASFTSQNLGGTVFDGLRIDWSTSVMSGMVFGADLSDLSVSLTNGGVPVYTDVAIVGGVTQPIAGIPRGIGSHIVFGFDLGALPMGLSSFSNDVNGATGGSAADGTSFLVQYIASMPDFVDVSRYDDGAGTNRIRQDALGISSTQNTVAIPEPSAFLLLGLLSCLGMVYRRGKIAQLFNG